MSSPKSKNRQILAGFLILAVVLLLFWMPTNEDGFKDLERRKLLNNQKSFVNLLVKRRQIDNELKGQDSSDSKFCFVVRTYKKQMMDLYGFISSAASSGLKDDGARVYLLLTSEDKDKWESTVASLEEVALNANTLLGIPNFATVLPTEYIDADQWGYKATDNSLRYFIYSQNNTYREKYPNGMDPYNCDYVIFSNGDNHYVRDWGKYMSRHVGSDLIYCDYVCRSFGTYRTTILAHSLMDLGAIAYKTETLRKFTPLFVTDDGRFLWDADGYFPDKILKRNGTTASHEKRLLFLHQ